MSNVVVIGAGIAGIQAALDIAAHGIHVHLIEREPTIGGHMAQLDKTFPTNDCSMCIESPKFVECSRHPNIEIMTYTEVDSVEGKTGDFKVTLVKKPRYVIESKCTGCTVCVEYCPVEDCMFWVPDEDHPPFGRIQVDPLLCIGCKKCTSKDPDGAFLDGCPWDAIVMVDTAEVEKEVGVMPI